MPEKFNYSEFLDVSEFIEPANEITSTCFNWCQEQGIIYQSNLDISNLGIITVALFALLLYNISVEWPDEVSKALKIDKDQLRFIGHAVVFFAFMLLALFLGYYSFVN